MVNNLKTKQHEIELSAIVALWYNSQNSPHFVLQQGSVVKRTDKKWNLLRT